MASVLHKTRQPADYRESVNTPDFPDSDWYHNPDISAVLATPRKYWVLGQTVTEMDQTAKDAVDAAEAAALLAAGRDRSKTEIDELLVMKALVKVLIDELNILRQWTRDFKTATADAGTLAAFKTNVAGLDNLADRTAAQARTAIKNEIDAI